MDSVKNKKIIILGRCLKLYKDGAQLHFKGVFLGHRVELVLILCFEGRPFKVGEDYLVYVSCLEIREGVLRARALKIKALHQIYWS